MKSKFLTTLIAILVGIAFGPAAHATLTTNSWSEGSAGEFKWETASDWSQHVPPSTAQSGVLITNFVSAGGGSEMRRITIDATTVLSNALNGCMTISNLTVSSPSVLGSDDLILNNTGSAELKILQVMSISNRCTLVITNSNLSFGPPNATDYQLGVDGAVLLEGGTITLDGSTIDGIFAPIAEVVGVNSSGTLTVAGGLNEVNMGGLAMGYNTGSTGTVMIMGGKLFVEGNISFGQSGVGVLIQSGGTVSMGAEFIGSNPGSQGTLTVAGGSHTANALIIGSGMGTTGTVWLTGGTLNSPAGTFIADFGVGSLIQSNGTFSTSDEEIGDDMGAGLLAIAGGTHNVEGGGLFVGTDGIAGNVWLTGGSLLVTNQPGIVIIVGSMTQSNGVLEAFSESVGGFAEEEFAGEGTLTMAGGTHIVGFGGLNVPDFTGSTGTVWVTGGHLLATSFANIIGDDGVGSLVQSNGNVEMILSEYVGNGAGAEGTLTVAGGTHSVEDGELTVGNSADSTGAVWVTGGELSSDSAAIGLAGMGQMTVSNGSWQAQDVSVGAASGGNGTLTVAGGTSVVSSDLTTGTPDCTGTGTVIVNGGSLFVTNATHNAVLDVESGAVTLRGGTLVVDVLVKTNPCAVFQQTGGILVVGGITNLFFPPPFQITSITQQNNNVLLTWTTPGGTTNQVQFTSGTGDGSYGTNGFTNLGSPMLIGGSGIVTTNYTDSGGATNKPARYYRVWLVP